MNLDIKDFTNVIIPLILQDRTDYYVKGGRVYDTYFVDKSGSIDWDIRGTSDFQKYIEQQCQEYATRFKVKILKRLSECETIDCGNVPLYQYGFEGYEEEKGDPFILDILIDNNFKPIYTTINKINYMNMIDFVKDLLITLDSRSSKLNVYSKTLDIKISPIYNEVQKYNSEYKTNFDIQQNFSQLKISIIEYLNKYINKIKSTTIKNIIKENIINNISKSDNFIREETDVQDILENTYPSEEETEEMDEFVQFFEEFNDKILSNITANIKNKLETNMISKKYSKTKKRTDNVINISWENLTDDYKKYLINECKKSSSNTPEITLFNVNKTCQAILNCKNTKIKKDTSKCIINPTQINLTNLYTNN